MGIGSVVTLDGRIKNILANTKKENPDKIVGLLRSEFFYVLKNYMDIKIEDIELNIGIDNNGTYVITFNAEVNRIFVAKHIF